MRRVTIGIWRVGLLIGLMLGLGLVLAACGDDEQAQSSTEAQQQTTPEAQQEQPLQESAAQEQTQQEQSAPAQQQQQQATDSLAHQQAEEQSEAADATQQQSAADQQQTAQQASSQDQQSQQQAMTPEEAVPEGTRLITLFGDLTEIVYALGVEEFLVARDTSSIWPRVVEDLPNLGFAGALNAEAILGFEPTLIIGTPMAGPPEVLEQLQQAGVDVLIIDDLNGLDAPQIKIRIVGEALGIVQRAEALAQDVEARMAAVIAASADVERPLRVMHIYIRRGGLQLVSGAGNKAAAIIDAAGGVDAAAEAGIVGWQPLSPEALVAADPDVYLVMDRGLEVIGGIDGLLEIPGMAETRAGEGPYVISMADLYLLGFGPRLPEAVADLAGFLREVRVEIDAEDSQASEE
ncbi:MAG: ABC transporter substrate-binding protein [Chloroflexi bacterium]|nr:ABC transporter substrate-binding protein [Chloroflexota bacterium]